MSDNKKAALVYVRQNIRFWREDRRLTVKQLAVYAGVSASSLGNMERGESPITVAALLRIADALKVSPERFLEAPPALHEGEIPPPQ